MTNQTYVQKARHLQEEGAGLHTYSRTKTSHSALHHCVQSFATTSRKLRADKINKSELNVSLFNHFFAEFLKLASEDKSLDAYSSLFLRVIEKFFFLSVCERIKELHTHQLVEDRYVVGVGQEGSVALRRCGEGSSVHGGEHVGERPGRTELRAGAAAAGQPLPLRRVYRSDVLISQLRERHGERRKEGEGGRKSLPRSHHKASLDIHFYSERM